MKYKNEFDAAISRIDNSWPLEKLCGIFNQYLRPHIALSAEHPLCCISPAADELRKAGFRKGYASAASSVPYPPKEALYDLECAATEIDFFQMIIEKSVSKALNSSLDDARSFSALTLKAALSGAFTKDNE